MPSTTVSYTIFSTPSSRFQRRGGVLIQTALFSVASCSAPKMSSLALFPDYCTGVILHWSHLWSILVYIFIFQTFSVNNPSFSSLCRVLYPFRVKRSPSSVIYNTTAWNWLQLFMSDTYTYLLIISAFIFAMISKLGTQCVVSCSSQNVCHIHVLVYNS